MSKSFFVALGTLGAIVAGSPAVGTVSVNTDLATSLTLVDPGFRLPFAAGTWHPISQGPAEHAAGVSPEYNRHAVDFEMPVGTPVLASASGTVQFAGVDGTDAIQVRISHGGDACSQYVHLSSESVTVGQSIERGQQIGLSGETGWADGPHLHWNMVYCSSEISRNTINTLEMGTSYPVGPSAASRNAPLAAKPGTTVITDTLNRVWMFAVKQNGTMYYRRTTNGPATWGAFQQISSAGSWSPGAAPAVIVDNQARVWMFGVKKNGRLYYRHTVNGPATWGSFGQVGNGGWSTTSTPTVITDTLNRVWMFAVKQNGTMYYRRTTNGPATWGAFQQISSAGSWSPGAAPAVIVDNQARVWMFGVKKNGRLYYRHTVNGPATWGSFGQVGNGGWSTTSTPTVITDTLNRVWMFAVKQNGTMYYRRTINGPATWHTFQNVGAGWAT